ncbi:MAG: efflux transporter outer membrane subunit [Xanthobacteraceae bacterium]|nr:efflux transporter outer membrane subunit [Xanthobacteraceae bacterium]
MSPAMHGIARLCALALVAPALSACNLTVDQIDLTVAAPTHYRAAPRPAGPPPALDWWRGFRSAELTRLVERAQTMNLDIAAAVARIEQADAQTRITGAPLLPLIDLDASASRARAGGSERGTYTAVLNASYEIDFWGKNRAAHRAAGQLAIASRFDRDTVALSTVATVANTYLQILAAQDRLRIARENLANANRVLAVIRERLAAGTATSLDIAQQESVVAQQRAAIPPLEQQVRENAATLAALLGEPPVHVRVRGGSLFRLAVPRAAPGLPSELLLQRPDIRAAEADLAAAQADVESARAALFPSIQLTGEAGFQSAALKTLFRPEAAIYTVAAGLTQPIFEGGRLLGQLDLQKGRRLELLQVYRRTAINAFADVERALIAMQHLARQESLQQQAVATARRAYEIAQTQLRAGTIDLTTVLNTQRTFFQEQDALALVRLTRLQAAVSLFQALGGGWAPTREIAGSAL